MLDDQLFLQHQPFLHNEQSALITATVFFRQQLAAHPEQRTQ